MVSVAFVVILLLGPSNLPSPLAPITDPLFTGMEVLFIVLMPLLIGLMVAVQAWAHRAAKIWGVLAIVFTALSCW